MSIINISSVTFESADYPWGPRVTKEVLSNPVLTYVLKDYVLIEKHVNKKIASVFDVLTYTITITNNSNYLLTNTYFLDPTPNDTHFIAGSVYINNQHKCLFNPNDGLIIPTIVPKSKTVITFSVVVLETCFNLLIDNFCAITYDYYFKEHEEPLRKTKLSNLVTTKVLNEQIYKKPMVSIIELPKIAASIHEVKDIDLLVKHCITERFIQIINNESIPMLYIKGTIRETIHYIDIYKNKKVIYFDQPFKETIHLPMGSKYFRNRLVRIHFKEIEAIQNSSRSLNLHYQLLIEYPCIQKNSK